MKKTLDPVLPPPGHLSERSKNLWLSIVGRRAVSVERLAAFQTALECRDRADEARELISGQGLLIKGEKMDHVHPLLKIEKDNRQLFAKIWKELGLFFDVTQF